MENKRVIVCWAVLIAYGLWESTDLMQDTFSSRASREAPPLVVTDETPPIAPAEVETAKRADPVERPTSRSEDAPKETVIKLNEYQQTDPFAPVLEEVEQGAELVGVNAPGNTGPFDADGNLIFPIDIGEFN